MKSWTGRKQTFMLVVAFTVAYIEWNIRKHRCNIFRCDPIGRIFRMVIITFHRDAIGTNEMFLAAVVVFVLCKGMVFAYGFAEVFQGKNRNFLGVCAVLWVAYASGGVKCNISHIFTPFLMFLTFTLIVTTSFQKFSSLFNGHENAIWEKILKNSFKNFSPHLPLETKMLFGKNIGKYFQKFLFSNQQAQHTKFKKNIYSF